MPTSAVSLAAQRLGGQPVAEQEVVRGGGRGVGVPQSRGVGTVPVPVVGHHLRLVQRDPAGHPVAERLRADRGVVGEAPGGVAHRPAAFVLELLGKVPVVEGDGGRDAMLAEFVEHRAVVVEARLAGGAAPARLDPRPGDGEPVGPQAERGHQRDVLAVPVVGVAGDVARVPAADLARRMAEGVPDRGALAVCARRSLDLVSGRRRAPDEPGRELKDAVGTSHRPLPLLGYGP